MIFSDRRAGVCPSIEYDYLKEHPTATPAEAYRYTVNYTHQLEIDWQLILEKRDADYAAKEAAKKEERKRPKRPVCGTISAKIPAVPATNPWGRK